MAIARLDLGRFQKPKSETDFRRIYFRSLPFKVLIISVCDFVFLKKVDYR